MQVLIDIKHIGAAMQHGRHNAHICRTDAARIFGMTKSEYSKIEKGRKMWPANMMLRLMSLAFIQMRTRQFTNADHLRSLKPVTADVTIIGND